MHVRVVGTALLAALCLGAASASDAAPARPLLGVLGNPQRFERLTGQRSSVRHVIMAWSQGGSARQLLDQLTPVPMLGLNTEGVITPLGIAEGKGDGFLLTLNAALAAHEGIAYVRPLPEMNGHWNDYCAFTRDGHPKGRQYSTAAFRAAFARIYLLLHGGPMKTLNARLRRIGEPGVTADLPTTQVRVIWNPQGYGSPDIPGNSAQAYYPGDPYVDVVGNDLYDQGFNAAWDANERLYAAYPTKPYAMAEWGLWGIDDPAFVVRMAAFVRSHSRVELVAYFHGKAGSPWDLSSKPRSRAAYRKLITPLG
jgi:Glycosyl hydrolase family 26